MKPNEQKQNSAVKHVNNVSGSLGESALTFPIIGSGLDRAFVERDRAGRLGWGLRSEWGST